MSTDRFLMKALARPRESATIFSLSPVFVGLRCTQASRVSVNLSPFTFLSVVFIDFMPRFCSVS